MDRNRDTETGSRSRGRYDERSWGEDFDREGYTREERGREPQWERDRYGRGGGYGQGSGGGYNEQHTSDYRSDHGGEERWRSGRDTGGGPGRNEWGREDRAGGWTASQYDRGGWGSGNFSQTWGGGTHSSGHGYEDAYDRGRETRDDWNRANLRQQHSGTYGGYGYGSGMRDRDENRESWNRDRDRDWNEDTRDRGESPGIMESIGRFFGFGPKNYRRSDERVTEEINDRLYRHPEIDASDVDVTVKEGDVTLSGTVDSRRAKYLAEELCDQVMGVKDVNNQLRVRKTAGAFDRGMGGSTLGTSTSGATTGAGTTGTLGQSQTGTTRDIGEPTRSRNK
jgi:hypothetical protein